MNNLSEIFDHPNAQCYIVIKRNTYLMRVIDYDFIDESSKVSICYEGYIREVDIAETDCLELSNSELIEKYCSWVPTELFRDFYDEELNVFEKMYKYKKLTIETTKRYDNQKRTLFEVSYGGYRCLMDLHDAFILKASDNYCLNVITMKLDAMRDKKEEPMVTRVVKTLEF